MITVQARTTISNAEHLVIFPANKRIIIHDKWLIFIGWLPAPHYNERLSAPGCAECRGRVLYHTNVYKQIVDSNYYKGFRMPGRKNCSYVRLIKSNYSRVIYFLNDRGGNKEAPAAGETDSETNLQHDLGTLNFYFALRRTNFTSLVKGNYYHY